MWLQLHEYEWSSNNCHHCRALPITDNFTVVWYFSQGNVKNCLFFWMEKCKVISPPAWWTNEHIRVIYRKYVRVCLQDWGWLKSACSMGVDSYNLEPWSSLDDLQILPQFKDFSRNLSWPFFTTVIIVSLNLEKENPCSHVQFHDLPQTFELFNFRNFTSFLLELSET